MGLFDDFFSKQTSSPNRTNATGSISRNKDAAEIYETGENVNTTLGNWYKQKPYAFEYGSSSDSSLRTMYLPISPSNLNISTHFATNVISTMYGTVEEHSEQRYFDITISGTTGMSPKYYKEVGGQILDSIDPRSIGRAGTPIKSKIGGNTGLGGFLSRTKSLVENTLNQVSDLLEEDKPTTGIDLQRTGYAAFHNLYKFLLVHKKLAAGENIDYKSIDKTLRFINYKDNNKYDIVIQGFQLIRNAQNPMLYNYNIVMRAYNLTTAVTKNIIKDVQSRAEELGLSGIQTTSVYAKIANKARQAKNAANSAIAAARGFGS